MARSVLLADDHAMVRQGLRILLENSGYTIAAEADSGESAYLAWQEHQPAIVLLDIDMPGMGGFETLRRILAQDRHAHIVIYSMHDDPLYAIRALQAGASGYVAKSDPPELLLDALSRALRGQAFIGHQLAMQVAMQSCSGKSNPADTLSPREFEVFRRLAAGESLADIARQLHIGYKSVANLQTRIRQKLGVQTTEQLAQIAACARMETENQEQSTRAKPPAGAGNPTL